MIKNKRFLLISIIAILICLMTPSFTFASGGDGSGKGDGSGSGENKDISLTLVDSSVSDKSTDIAVNETIQLDFNKNICNITVLDNNKKCFHLTDANGNVIPIKLIFPDNQVQQKYKDQAFIIPKQDLESNMTYRIAVDNTLLAKNGTYIDNAHTITFTTGTERSDNKNEILSELGDYTVIYETAYKENKNSVLATLADLDKASEDTGMDTGSLAKIAAAVFIIVIIAFTALFFIIKRKK